VQEPVYLRPRWSESGDWVFHFILQQKARRKPCLITAHWNPEIERFISQEGWQVDRFPERVSEIIPNLSQVLRKKQGAQLL
jgi:hypothetical protein